MAVDGVEWPSTCPSLHEASQAGEATRFQEASQQNRISDSKIQLRLRYSNSLVVSVSLLLLIIALVADLRDRHGVPDSVSSIEAPSRGTG